MGEEGRGGLTDWRALQHWMLPVLQEAALWLGLVVALGLAAARDAAAAGCADADAAHTRQRKKARKSVGTRANIV